jgi:hypothetical protein
MISTLEADILRLFFDFICIGPYYQQTMQPNTDKRLASRAFVYLLVESVLLRHLSRRLHSSRSCCRLKTCGQSGVIPASYLAAMFANGSNIRPHWITLPNNTQKYVPTWQPQHPTNSFSSPQTQWTHAYLFPAEQSCLAKATLYFIPPHPAPNMHAHVITRHARIRNKTSR